MAVKAQFLRYLCCPKCHHDLVSQKKSLFCKKCSRVYPVKLGIPILTDLNHLSGHQRQQIDYFQKQSIMTTAGYELEEWHKSFLRRFRENFKEIKNKLVIDAGIGQGYMTIELAKRGAVLLSFDLALPALVRLKSIMEKKGLADRVFLVCCSAEALAFKTDIADYFIANAVLEHLEKEKEAIQEIGRVAKKKSGLMVTVPLHYGYLHPLFIAKCWVQDRIIGHLRRYDEESLQQRFCGFGWQVKKVYYSGHFLKVMLTVLFGKRCAWAKRAEAIDRQAEGKKYGASNLAVIFQRNVEVLLINPFLEVLPDDPADISPPLGLAYLAAYLENKGVSVAILDIAAEGINQRKKINQKIRYGLSNQAIIKKIKHYSPQIVGIGCQSTLHAAEAQETACLVKKANPEILVVMGGAHPSVMFEKLLQDKNIDLVIKGEGELTFWEIIRRFKQKKSLKKILGTNNNLPRPRIKNLDVLPFPARHLLPMEIYFQQARQKTNYNFGQRVMTMISSRGCPGSCVYCSVRTIWGRVWRGRSAKNVVDEMEILIEIYGADEIHFLDDSIGVDKERLQQICREIIKRDLKIRWTTPNGIAIWLLDKKLLKLMKRAGCYRLTFGLESGNQEILQDYIGKHYNFDQAKELIAFASRLGLWTIATFILGFPDETREQIEETINFAMATDLDFAVFYLANPFPGTAMYDDFLNQGLLPPGGGQNIVRGCRTKHFSHRQLVELQAEAFNRFLKSRLRQPWRVLNKIHSFQDLLYTYKLSKNLMKMLINQTLIKTKGIAWLWR